VPPTFGEEARLAADWSRTFDRVPRGLIASGDRLVCALKLDAFNDDGAARIDEAKLRFVFGLEGGADRRHIAGGKVQVDRGVGALVAQVQDRVMRRIGDALVLEFGQHLVAQIVDQRIEARPAVIGQRLHERLGA
jgi:hypothetical protein